MATMEEVRKQYPQYNDMSDEALAKALHQKFYSDMPFEDFAARVGIAQAPGYGEDMAKGFGAGAVRGAIGLPGGFGDAASMTQRAVEGAAGYLGAPEWLSQGLGKGARMLSPFPGMPTTEQLTGAVESVTGPMYEAKTTPGEFSQTAGQMLPTLLGPGSWPSKIGAWLGGSLGSEGAGQATEDSWAEPYARVAGGLLGAVGGGMAGGKLTGTGPQAKPAVKELDELYKIKSDAYRAVDSSGVRYSPQAYDDMLNTVDSKWASMNFNPQRHDKAMAFVKTLQANRGRDLTLTELDQLRQTAFRDIVKNGDDANAAFGNVIMDKIDDMIQNTSPQMMAQGDPAMAASLIKKARDANKVYRTSEKVMTKLDRAERQAMATGKGTNQDNALRQKTNELINENKGREFKKYPQDVQDKMNEVVRGKKPGQVTSGRNVARKIGMAAPTGIVSGALAGGGGGAAGSFIGGLLGGPPGAAAGAFIGGAGVPAIGQAGKMMADRGTRKAVEDLLRIIQANGSAANAGINNPSLLGQSVPAGLLGGYSASPRVRSGQVSSPAKR